MEQLEAFAKFLHDYGAHALASVFALLYWAERRERQATQKKFEHFLELASQKVQDNASAISETLRALEHVLSRVSSKNEDPND